MSQLKLIVEIVAGVASAIGVTVALIRPWLREITSRKRLKLTLHNTVGDETTSLRTVGGKEVVYYYYLKVENGRPSMPANNVRVVITGRSELDGSLRWIEKPVIVPVPLTWSFPREKPVRITISKSEICDLGFMRAPDGVTPYFLVSTYGEQTPANFALKIVPTQTVRFRIEAHADDCFSDPIVIEMTNSNSFTNDGLRIGCVSSLLDKRPRTIQDRIPSPETTDTAE